MKRPRHHAVVAAWVLLPIVLLVGLIVWGSFGTATDSLAGNAVIDDDGSVLVVLPAGWKHDPQDPGPIRLLTAWTKAKFPALDCDVDPQLDVRLQIEDFTDVTGTSGEFAPRRRDYGAKSGNGFEGGDEFNCGEEAQGIFFTEHGRAYAATVFVGKHASTQHLAEAYQILNAIQLPHAK